jgi:hypothetical protein
VKNRWLVFGLIGLSATVCRGVEDFIQRVDDSLSVSLFDGEVRARLSGTIDLEGYNLPQPAPALIDTDGHDLFSPRLALFLDLQLGAKVYIFAQTRVDRGFDPGYGDAQIRLDEYAVRFTPWKDSRLNVQFGKFSTVVGNWAPRHNSWTNAFITAPLLYENLTGIWDAVAAKSSSTLLQWAHLKPGPLLDGDDKSLRLPVIWGPSYATGGAISGQLGKMNYALEVKDSSLSSRPEVWAPSQVTWDHPTFSSRIGYQPNAMWNLGFSASSGVYLRPSAEPTLAPGHGFGDYRELVLGEDFGFAWHHWQAWAEWYATRFEIPTVGRAGTFAYYVEVKYKFTPQFFGSVRWNQELYGDIPDHDGSTSWGRDVARLDLAPGYRFTPHTQIKLQYSLQHTAPPQGGFAQTIAGQFTLRF